MLGICLKDVGTTCFIGCSFSFFHKKKGESHEFFVDCEAWQRSSMGLPPLEERHTQRPARCGFLFSWGGGGVAGGSVGLACWGSECYCLFSRTSPS